MSNHHTFTLVIALLTICVLSSGCIGGNDATGETAQIFLVRHAEKADDGTADPPLTELGNSRAQRLAELLSDEGIEHVFSSDYKRTKETAAPLANKLGLEVKSYDPGDFKDLLQFIKEHPGEHMLIVGHSNSTPALANALLNEETYEQFDESDYGNLIEIEVRGRDKESRLRRF